ncbi:DegV family protein [Levilactobacillus spicheri]
MKIAIMTDTSAGMTPTEAIARQVTLLAAPIMFGNRQYHEYQDLTPADYYRLLRLTKSTKLIPTAPQLSMQTVQATCDDLAAQGVTDVIVIGPASGISGFINTLSSYAETITSLHVWPWDSRGILTVMGDQVRLAAALAERGADVQTILGRLATLRQTMHVGFAVDSIKPLLRTGEVNPGHGPSGAQLLAGKPLLVFEPDGKIRVAGSALRLKNALGDLLDLLAPDVAAQPTLKATILNADQPELAQQWLMAAHDRFPQTSFDVALIGPSFGVHVGDGAMGLAWGQDYRELLDPATAD